jgi:ATP-dependent HslUV protease ATP-binding subunit HslU
MVRDLVELAVDMVRAEKAEEVQDKAKAAAEERLLDLLLPPSRVAAPGEDPAAVRDQANRTRERMREALHAGRLDDRSVDIEVRESAMPSFEIIAGTSVEEIGVNLKDMMGNMFQGRTKSRRMKVPDAQAHLLVEEQGKLVDMESVSRAAVQRVEHAGIIFIDEIDKIASRDGLAGGGHGGPDVSREGVQRDILPIVEGTTVNTKHGMVKTDHILFIAAGAFHVSKPSDLIPELQGRFPIRVELEPLTRDDFVRILTEPRNALVRQYTALLGTEELTLDFTPGAVERIADFAARVNDATENIGARRLHTVMERLLDELSFEAPDIGQKTVVIDELYVDQMLADVVKNEDLSRYIL